MEMPKATKEKEVTSVGACVVNFASWCDRWVLMSHFVNITLWSQALCLPIHVMRNRCRISQLCCMVMRTATRKIVLMD